MRVLIIDDNMVDFRLVERALGNSFSITRAETLGAGTELAARNTFDLLILDLFLPDSRGYETFERARVALPWLPILVLSGSDDDALALKTVGAGAQDFVRKSQLLETPHFPSEQTEYPLERAAKYAVERFRAARAVRESERKYHTLFDSLPIAAYMCDAEGLLTYYNKKAVDLWGRVPKLNDPDYRYSGSLRLMCRDGTAMPHENSWMARALAERKAYNDCETIIERPDGEQRTVRVNVTPILNEEGKLLGGIKLLVDITDLRQTEAKLVESERFSRAVVDALSAEVAILDITGKIIATNLAWQKYGEENGLASAEATTNINYLEICEQAVGAEAEFGHQAARGMRSVLSGERNEFYMEYPCHSPKAQCWYAMRVTCFGEGDDTRLVVTHENITERKRNSELELERQSLHGAVASMDRVLGVVGHELRTPLAGLQAIAEFLLDSRSRNTPDFEKFLVSLKAETIRMSDTVDNLLEAARLNSGRAKWNWGKFALADVCSEAIEGIRPLIDSDAITLGMNIQPPAAEMRGDAGAIRRLVINLLTNAKKHTSRGRIDLTVRLNNEKDGALWAELSISDTGDGIEPAILDRLGQAFSLNSGVIGDSHVKGSGLGLAICKGIVAAHGGVIAVDSVRGKGTVITARLRADLSGAVESEPAEQKIIAQKHIAERAA